VDLMLGRGNTAPVYPWFGQDIRQGLPLALESYNLLHRLWREDVVVSLCGEGLLVGVGLL
jgi:alkanesulfonate monooxygenase SsuD/methylene tetrahydromethanopterin reductase-like flavin-dependent oxidoreductase (luciferase family)